MGGGRDLSAVGRRESSAEWMGRVGSAHGFSWSSSLKKKTVKQNTAARGAQPPLLPRKKLIDVSSHVHVSGTRLICAFGRCEGRRGAGGVVSVG